VSRSITRGCAEAQNFPRYACWLSSEWRSEITRVARRQTDWHPGLRDIDLLARGELRPTRTHGTVLVYGEPSLLVTRAETGLIPIIERCVRDIRWRLQTRYLCIDPASLVEELLLAIRLCADLKALAAANARAPLWLVVVNDTENDDGRACEARPSRSTQKPYQVWPPVTAGG
jgi:hypothetical protein